MCDGAPCYLSTGEDVRDAGDGAARHRLRKTNADRKYTHSNILCGGRDPRAGAGSGAPQTGRPAHARDQSTRSHGEPHDDPEHPLTARAAPDRSRDTLEDCASWRLQPVGRLGRRCPPSRCSNMVEGRTLNGARRAADPRPAKKWPLSEAGQRRRRPLLFHAQRRRDGAGGLQDRIHLPGRARTAHERDPLGYANLIPRDA